MTSKERAFKIIQKFGILGMEWNQTEYNTLDLDNAKQCALAAVGEIKEALTNVTNATTNKEYWDEVELEIIAFKF